MYVNHPRYSIRNIISDNWNKHKINHSELDPYILMEIERMLDCCNSNKGFFYGYCKNPLDCVAYYPNGSPSNKELKEKLDY